jgi:hypothetical protein
MVAASAVFVKLDTTTSGNWPGVYGAQGFTVLQQNASGGPPSLASVPSYATVAATGASYTGWSWGTTDTRGLPVSTASGAMRIAMVWYSPTTFTVNVNLTDGMTHQVAIYCVDWDSSSRAQQVQVIDAASGSVLNTQTLTAGSFHNGVYLVWAISGNVNLVFTRQAGSNAVVTGLFLDASATVATTTTLTSSVNPSLVGQMVTFTATVIPAGGKVAPTGTVSFYDNSTTPPTLLGTGKLS